MSNFKVGDRVVCIKKGEWSHEEYEKRRGVVFPSYLQELTIRDVSIHGLRFVELKNPIVPYSTGVCEAAFCESRFRRLNLDYNFVEEVIKQIQPEKVRLEKFKQQY